MIFISRTISCPQGRVKRPQEFYVGAVLVVTSGYGPRTAWQGCILMVWLNNSHDSTGTPCGARTGIVRAPYGNFQCFSYPTGPVQDPQGRGGPTDRRLNIYVPLNINTLSHKHFIIGVLFYNWFTTYFRCFLPFQRRTITYFFFFFAMLTLPNICMTCCQFVV